MSAMDFLLPFAFAIFLWWFSTGSIIAVYTVSRYFMTLAFALSTVMMLVALALVWVTRDGTEVRHVYIAATCGVVLMGWQLSSYYLGFITGPRQEDRDLDGASETLLRRFGIALSSGLYHETLTLIMAVILVWMTWQQPNRWAFWMYLALWLMHSSAKLNVFLGVRNFRIDLLPDGLRHLDALLTKQESNVLFPFSVIVASSVALALLYQGVAPGTADFQATGLILVATMIGLGIIEHVMMVLPFSVIFYGWGLRHVDEGE